MEPGAHGDVQEAAVDVAVVFVAWQRGGAQRILVRHRCDGTGRCLGCLTRPTPYPCQVARIALRAAEIARAPSDAG